MDPLKITIVGDHPYPAELVQIYDGFDPVNVCYDDAEKKVSVKLFGREVKVVLAFIRESEKKYTTKKSSLFRSAKIVFILFSMDNFLSFKNLRQYLTEVERNCCGIAKMIVVGLNRTTSREVEDSDVKEFCQQFNLPYFEVSMSNKIAPMHFLTTIVHQHLDEELEIARVELQQSFHKVTLLGDPASGKSTLLRRLVALQEKSGDPKKFYQATSVATPGIDVHILPSAEPQHPSLAFYDFGGQETLFPTHQLFLTSGALFLLVVDFSLDEKSPCFEYWINQIQRHGGHATTLLVCTHMDAIAGGKREVSARRDALVERLERVGHWALPQDRVFLFGKKSKASAVAKLLSALQERSHSLLAVSEAPDESWLHFFVHLRRLRDEHIEGKKKPFLEFEEYAMASLEFGVAPDQLMRCTRFLVERGALVTLVHEASSAPDLIILDPKWLADLFSTVVSINPAGSWHKYLGIVERRYLHTLWESRGFERAAFERMEALLVMFELIVPIDGSRLLVPSMAWRPLNVPAPPKEEVEREWPEMEMIDDVSRDGDGDREFGRRLELEFVPTGFLQRVLARLCEIEGVEIIPELLQRKDYFLRWKRGDGVRIRLREVEGKDPSLTILVRAPKKSVGVAVPPIFLYIVFSSLEGALEQYCVRPSVRRCVVLRGGRDIGAVEDVRMLLLSFDDNDDEEKAPDLLLPGIPRFSDSQLPLEEASELARGANGAVLFSSLPDDGCSVVIKTPLGPAGYGTAAFVREALIMDLMGRDELCVNSLLGIHVSSQRQKIGLVLSFVKRADLGKFVELENSSFKAKRAADAPLYAALLRPAFKLRVARDVARGMARIHSNVHSVPVIHADLRAANVFLNGDDEEAEEPCAVVGDVGGALLTRLARKPMMNACELAPEMCFTAIWTGYGQPADVYCYSLILWQLLSLKYPPNLGRKVLEGARPKVEEENWTTDEEKKIIEVMKECWESDPSQRPTFSSIFNKLKLN